MKFINEWDFERYCLLFWTFSFSPILASCRWAFYFVLCSAFTTVGYTERRMRLNNKNKIFFILYCVRLSLPLQKK